MKIPAARRQAHEVSPYPLQHQELLDLLLTVRARELLVAVSRVRRVAFAFLAKHSPLQERLGSLPIRKRIPDRTLSVYLWAAQRSAFC